jgi:hypothetical protein
VYAEQGDDELVAAATGVFSQSSAFSSAFWFG